MPTYQYACDRCGIVEVFQSIKAATLTKCPQCKNTKVSRIISGGSGVMFTGSGFWETDYNRSAEYKTKTKEDAKASNDTPAVATPAPAVQPAAAVKPAPATPAAAKSPTPKTKPSTKE
jgi:putative FmdB family regulatory protein